MADPFSISVGALGLIDGCTRLLQYLNDLRKGTIAVDEDIKALVEKVHRVQNVASLIKGTCDSEGGGEGLVIDGEAEDDRIRLLWSCVSEYLQECLSVVEELDSLIIHIVGRGAQLEFQELPTGDGEFSPSSSSSSSNVASQVASLSKLERLRVLLRKRDKEKVFERIASRLDDTWKTADLLLTAINIATSRRFQKKADVSLQSVAKDIINLGDRLEKDIGVIKRDLQQEQRVTLRRVLTAAEEMQPLATINQHFYLPRPVDSCYTGRQDYLDKLRSIMFDDNGSIRSDSQKRFCLYGLGGSGKTEFCCKFAQENQRRLWGVFWIDASSPSRVRQCYSDIALIAGRDPNERAAKAWLSSTEKPWLLIIDNADNDSDLEELQEYLPGGKSGIVLLTTRNPAHRTLGTVGCRYFHFSELQEQEANSLLLKAADEPLPWTTSAQSAASIIAKTLGCLPLPLRHAGKAIVDQLCTLHNYVTFYERCWEKVRRSRKSLSSDKDQHLKAYSSYEIMYEALELKNTTESKDALDMLKIFSFLYREHVSETIIFASAVNFRLERQHQERSQKQEKSRTSERWHKQIIETLRHVPLHFYSFLIRIGNKSSLPQVLRPLEENGMLDDDRLRTALKELTHRSLVFFNAEKKSYSMHPLVHRWVRERREMSTAEQAIYCNAAASLLAQCILIPPLGTDEAAENLRRELLPHIEHVEKCKIDIERDFRANRGSQSRLIPPLTSSLDREHAIQLVKFSLVYSQCGRYVEAKKLQETVRFFAINTLGQRHLSAMDITLLLSGTLWQLGESDEAAALQANVLETCQKSRGSRDLKTLKVQDILGVTRWLQGQFSEAEALHRRAVLGLDDIQGSGHPDTLKAKTNLGRVLGKQCQYDEAIELHRQALLGLKGVYGDSHLETLITMDNLAMSLLDRFVYADGELDDLREAHILENQVVERRKRKLGPEHPYTLWAMCNLARIGSAQGKHAEAERVMKEGIQVAERNLGETHIGTLFGKLYLGNTLIESMKYEEGEKVLKGMIADHAGSGRPNHPDALLALSYLLKSYLLTQRNDDAAKAREKIKEGMRAIGGDGHPWEQRLLEPRLTLVGGDNTAQWISSKSVTAKKIEESPIGPLNRSSTA